MSELLEGTERKLWHDGPNYTADAVVIDDEHDKILLIERSDTGDWAFPGGFIDANDVSTHAAAVREAFEETGVVLPRDGVPIFSGVVDDPRNSLGAWIETSAYLFRGDSRVAVAANDDASGAAWFPLDDMPELYASHEQIFRTGLDRLRSLRELCSSDMITGMRPVDGGHMQYDKHLFESDGKLLFSKAHSDDNFTDAHKAERSKLYLKKEADVMTHLRTNGFGAVPQHSVLLESTLFMDAFSPDHDWQWRAPKDNRVTHYVSDTLAAFEELESTPLISETFEIEPSYQSFKREGWQALTDETLRTLKERVPLFEPRMTPDSQRSAKELMSRLSELQREGLKLYVPDRFVASHHDARQSNIAWHPNGEVRIVDWSWFGAGEPGSDATNFLIDIHKSGHDISDHLEVLNPHHCLILIGFWLAHASWPIHNDDDSVRFQQFVSAVSAYEVLTMLQEHRLAD